MKTIAGPHYRVNSFENLQSFYCDCLGMQDVSSDQKTLVFGYERDGSHVHFEQRSVGAYRSRASDFYWKIGITLRNLDMAVAFLRSKGIQVSDPHQFHDIGYMSKIIDPNGFIIELLQQGFEGNEKQLGTGHAIGSQATLAHITLRVTDLASSKSYFEHDLGMRLMSIQPVAPYGFCLYFYCWNNEPLPDPDLKSVDNREWLWRRPFMLIELQHLEKPDSAVHRTPHDMAGFEGFSYRQENGAQTPFVSNSMLYKLT